MDAPTNLRQETGANLASVTQLAAALTMPGQWSISSNPGVGVKASASKAALVGVRHVCNCFYIGASAPIAGTYAIVANVRNGATGAGTIIWQDVLQLVVPAVVGGGEGRIQLFRTGLQLFGSVNTAMTIEFNALSANVTQCVNLAGFSVS